MSRLAAVLCIVAALAIPATAEAVTMSLVSESQPFPGITLKQYKTTSPKTNCWAVLVDLCADYVHVDATPDPSGPKTVAQFGQDSGVQVAVNGDFYKSPPAHVYGAAVGGGIQWPSVKQGFDPSYSGEWFFMKYGWLAFGHDLVEHNHTKWVKQNVAGLTSGWEPTDVVTSIPAGTLALVSGFSQLVIDGEPVTCPDPTASSCFPDRSDMRDRHPRTAMGITEDRKTFILFVVDGRTDVSIGMYGTELADVMHKLGAHQAFNLDGGGSSQLWVKGKGTVNDANGNNNGGGLRPVLNHWGVFAGPASGKAKRPGHCVSSPACAVLPPEGGTLDDSGPCFAAFGTPEYWRTEAAGFEGGLHWTNAWKTTVPDNWAWWQVHLAEGGKYRVDYYAVPEFAVFKKTHYEVRASGTLTKLSVDQSIADGWTELGEFDFSAGGGQWVSVFDDTPATVADDQHIVADAIRLVRLDPWCGNGQCDGTEECGSCVEDCGECPEPCGNSECKEGESCETCPADCGDCPESCGDGSCGAEESCSSCPADCGECPETCGNGSCASGESCESCPEDCGECSGSCGNGLCDAWESCATCPAECGNCPDTCGDGLCDEWENCGTCPKDCGSCVPDVQEARPESDIQSEPELVPETLPEAEVLCAGDACPVHGDSASFEEPWEVAPSVEPAPESNGDSAGSCSAAVHRRPDSGPVALLALAMLLIAIILRRRPCGAGGAD